RPAEWRSSPRLQCDARCILKRPGSQCGCRAHAAAVTCRLFFFSSRRRHTRFDCDWSSDVCSSDLGTGLLASMVEEALGELVFRGLITADSFTGLRALLTPLSKTTSRAVENRRRRRKPVYSMDEAGRWVIVRVGTQTSDVQAVESNAPAAGGVRAEIDRESIEAVAKKLMQRYGVVFRKIL